MKHGLTLLCALLLTLTLAAVPALAQTPDMTPAEMAEILSSYLGHDGANAGQPLPDWVYEMTQAEAPEGVPAEIWLMGLTKDNPMNAEDVLVFFDALYPEGLAENYTVLPAFAGRFVLSSDGTHPDGIAPENASEDARSALEISFGYFRRSERADTVELHVSLGVTGTFTIENGNG